MGFLRNLKNGALGVMGINTSGLNGEEAEAFRKFIEKNESLADQAASTVMGPSTTDEERLEALGAYWFLAIMTQDPDNLPAARESEAPLLLARCSHLGVDLDRDNPFEGLPDFERGCTRAMEESVSRFEQTGLARPGRPAPSPSSSAAKTVRMVRNLSQQTGLARPDPGPSRSSSAAKGGRIQISHRGRGL